MMTDEKVEECVHTLREENAEATIISTPWDELGREAISHALTKELRLRACLKNMEITTTMTAVIMIITTMIITTMTIMIMTMITAVTTIITTMTIMTMITAVTTIITIITIMTTMTTLMTAAADMITIMITTIIMQMMCLQAGAKRLFINIQKKNWIIC